MIFPLTLICSLGNFFVRHNFYVVNSPLSWICPAASWTYVSFGIVCYLEKGVPLLSCRLYETRGFSVFFVFGFEFFVHYSESFVMNRLLLRKRVQKLMPSRASLCRKCSDTILFYWESHVKIQSLYQMWIDSNYFGSTWECHVSHFAFCMGASWTLLLPPASTAMALYDRKDSDSHHFPVWNRRFFLLFLLPCQAKVASLASYLNLSLFAKWVLFYCLFILFMCLFFAVILDHINIWK